MVNRKRVRLRKKSSFFLFFKVNSQLACKKSLKFIVSLLQSNPSTYVKQNAIRFLGALSFRNSFVWHIFFGSFFKTDFLVIIGKIHEHLRKVGVFKHIMPCLSHYVSDNPALQRDSAGFIRLMAEADG